jgi:hypothetical protein
MKAFLERRAIGDRICEWLLPEESFRRRRYNIAAINYLSPWKSDLSLPQPSEDKSGKIDFCPKLLFGVNVYFQSAHI